MHRRNILALYGVALAVVLAPSAALGAGPPRVTVRVEGRTHTLLAPTVVQTHSGSITKGGAVKGACPATSAQGALDVATHHHWSGKWYSSYDEYEVFSILGDYESGTHYFWEIFVNNIEDPSGACGTKLSRGTQLLFAAVPVTGNEYPIVLTAHGSARAGQPLDVKVTWINGHGKAKPLAGAAVDGKVTGSHGTAQVVPSHAGTLVLRATRKGFVRSAPMRVRVSS